MNILHIDSSALGDHSASRRQTAATVAELCAGQGETHVVYRDLAAAPLSHISGPLLQALRGEWNQALPMNAEVRAEVLQSESLLREFQDADVVVLGAPLCNFSIPSTLKVWVDRLLQVGNKASAQDADRPAKRVIVAMQGACVISSGSPLAVQQETYFRAVFNHIGISELEIMHSDVTRQAQAA